MCFDTNALIYHLRRTDPYWRTVDELLASARHFFVSVVTEIELLVQPLRDHRLWEINRVRATLDSLEVVELDREIARIAADVRAESTLRLPDAVIVATALHTGCDAIVGNDARVAQRVKDISYFLLDDLVKEQPS